MDGWMDGCELIPEHECKTPRHPEETPITTDTFSFLFFLFDTIQYKTIQSLCKKTLPLGIEPRTYRLTADRSAD